MELIAGLNSGKSPSNAKGIDDAMVAGVPVEIIAGETVDTFVASMCAAALRTNPTEVEKKLAAAARQIETLLAELQLEQSARSRPLLDKDDYEALAYTRRFDLVAYGTAKSGLKEKGISLRELEKNLKPYCAKLSAELRKESGPEGFSCGEYSLENDHMIWLKPSKEGAIPTQLSNFSATIIAEHTCDNGAETLKTLQIEGKLAEGRQFAKISLPSTQFGQMNWPIECWGPDAIVSAGNIKDHLRVAIQTLSPNISQVHSYGHTGFRLHHGDMVYLHMGGGIGGTGNTSEIIVELHGGRLPYSLALPESPEDEKQAIHASLQLLELAPETITYPLFAAIYRAPLGWILPIDFGIWLAGPSGVFKSEVAALVQAHFGAEFTSRNLPGNWSSTANSLEKLVFIAKDTVLTIDDFAPTGGTQDIARLHSCADRLFRGLGNNAGRGRLDSHANLRATYYPRAIILGTGEDTPKGHSVRARMLAIAVAKNDVDSSRLTDLQGLAREGSLVKALSGYVRWVATTYETLKTTLPKRREELRLQAHGFATHSRTPDIFANLMLGLEIFGSYALAVDCISAEEHDNFIKNGWQSLESIARDQVDYQSSEEPAARFISLVRAAIASGEAHVADAKTDGMPNECTRWGWILKSADVCSSYGKKIGWVSEKELLLEPEAVYAVVSELARKQNAPIALSQTTLWKRLAEKGLIARTSEQKNLVRRVINSHSMSVLALTDKEILFRKNI